MHDLYPGNRYEGEILLHPGRPQHVGRDVDPIEMRMRIGMVFQKPNPFPKSIFENVAYGLRVRGVRTARELRRQGGRGAAGAALWNEVKDRLDDQANALSGGQQQRLCIARALATEPEMLLFDEPTSALDPIATASIEELIHQLKDRVTILIVTHNMQQAARVSDFTAFMYLGDLIEFGWTETCSSSRRTSRPRTTSPAGSAESPTEEPMNTSEHISKQYDADLAALRSRVVEMGGVVEEQFRFAVDALTSGRSDLAEQVVANDRRVNQFELDIDDDCAHVIAKRQPAASDLRMVLGVSKMVTDLERIGDKARKIARLSASVRSSGASDARWLEETHRVADDARGLLRDALNAFVRGEVDAAIAVIRAAQGIGRHVNAISGGLVQRISENPSQVAVLLDMMAINKAIDRVADHAANLAEHLIYIVKGTDVRHATLDQIERETLQR